MSDLEYSAMSQEELLYVVQAKDAEIERLKGDIQILKLQRDATHFSRCPRCNPKPRGEWCSSTDPTALEGDDG
jgi:hypothetical protein